MRPCAVISVYGDPTSSHFIPPVRGHANPVWDSEPLDFAVADDLLRIDGSHASSIASDDHFGLIPRFPHLVIKVFASSSLKKCLGRATVPLENAIRHYDLSHTHFYPLMNKCKNGDKAWGAIQVEVKVAQAGFAPRKGTAAYASFVRTPCLFQPGRREFLALAASRFHHRLPTTPCAAEFSPLGCFRGHNPPRTVVVQNSDGSVQGVGFRLQ